MDRLPIGGSVPLVFMVGLRQTLSEPDAPDISTG
jgi:hypothetical protein